LFFVAAINRFTLEQFVEYDFLSAQVPFITPSALFCLFACRIQCVY
jgi:hypothetical protein